MLKLPQFDNDSLTAFWQGHAIRLARLVWDAKLAYPIYEDWGELPHKLPTYIWPFPSLRDLCVLTGMVGRRNLKASNAEFRRKVDEGAIKVMRFFDSLPVSPTTILDREGYYEIRFGQRVLEIVVPPPWRASLKLWLARVPFVDALMVNERWSRLVKRLTG